MEQEALPEAKIPVATYRLQFNSEFTFSAAKEIIGYLNDLGISDLYASSYVAAKEGSRHGYDVVDPTILNREIGSEEEHRELSAELEHFGMGQILDFVPNHMCIESMENRWWTDVLENGPSSPHADFFDIDWKPVKKELSNKVLLPFLADQYGNVLEQGELHLVFIQGAFRIEYYDLKIPLEPRSYLQILEFGLGNFQQQISPDAPSCLELLSIITALQHLPSAFVKDPARQGERYREKEIIKKRLWQLYENNSEIYDHIHKNLAIINGSKGNRRSFELLDRLLCVQVFRLSHWRVASEEINYRRFFDINGLAAIRMEVPSVFKETHTLLFRMISEGKITGIRIDHIDGIYDPCFYLAELQKNCFIQMRHNGRNKAGTIGNAAVDAETAAENEKEYEEILKQNPAYKPFYIVCEKILMKGEHLREEWPVFGTTGYDFLCLLNGIFVDTKNAGAFDRIFKQFAGIVSDFSEIVYEKKKLVMQVSLASDVNGLAARLNTLSERNRLTRDFTLNSLAGAIREVIAFFPVYRTYVNSCNVREKDSQYIDVAVAKAKRKNSAIDTSVFDFLRSVLLLKIPEEANEHERGDWLDFAMKFQQITGPVMAKGMEDTTYYVYNRLISLNEVGGMPGRFGTPMEAFHGQNLQRIKSFPHALLATATHDTKRGEDVRMRIDVLSEIPGKWHNSLMKWSRLNRKKVTLIDSRKAPDPNEEYLLYQTLIGVWPQGAMTPEEMESFRTRISGYMVKAAREAKVNTSWINPDSSYEDALTSFIDAILADTPGNAFLENFIPFQKMIACYGIFNSLSQTLLKLTSPGVPDFYQGTELWDYSLVDPDNRRSVNYQTRIDGLACLKASEVEIGPKELFRYLLNRSEDGRIKLYLIFRVLGYRRKNKEIFELGEYLPLEGVGSRARNVCAFARRVNGRNIIVVVPRLLTTLALEPGSAAFGEEWEDTWLMLPEGTNKIYRNVLTDETLEAEHAGKMRIPLARLFESIPFALLEG